MPVHFLRIGRSFRHEVSVCAHQQLGDEAAKRESKSAVKKQESRQRCVKTSLDEQICDFPLEKDAL
jgi:hypothetical protein